MERLGDLATYILDLLCCYNIKYKAYEPRNGKKWRIKRRESYKPGIIFKIGAVYLLLRLKGMRESSKENWREMLNLGYAGHQNAVSVAFLVIENSVF